jgi:hypothetical protein
VSVSPAAMAAALAQAEAILDAVQGAGQDAIPPLSRLAQSITNDTINWLRNAPLDLPRKDGHRAAGVAPTKGGKLERDGVLEAYGAEGRIRITSRSIARRRIALAILSHPDDGPRVRIRQPVKRFEKSPRPRTAAELEGLRRGNEGRRLKAQEEQRRREVQAARV